MVMHGIFVLAHGAMESLTTRSSSMYMWLSALDHTPTFPETGAGSAGVRMGLPFRKAPTSLRSRSIARWDAFHMGKVVTDRPYARNSELCFRSATCKPK
jgi:hypothetical protein